MTCTIGIVGAGIGGLALAALALDAGHEVTLIERFAEPKPVGSGLVIQPMGLAVLDRFGAGAAARASGQSILRMAGHEARRGRDVLRVAYRPEAPGLAIHRAALFAALWDAAMARQVRIEAGATAIATPFAGKGRTVLLEDGRSLGPFDLVVDASGAGSRLSPLTARPLPYGALWGTVPWPAGTAFRTDELRQRYLSARRMLGVLPVGTAPGSDGPLATIFWSLPVDRIADWQAAPLTKWKAEASGLWPDFAPFLQTITRHDQLTPARYSHGTLCHPYAERLAFIGDAAHRASPQLGQGANMALLDALALVTALKDGPGALPAYGAMRRWHVRAYQAMSALFTPMYQSESRLLPPLRDHLMAPMAGLPLIRQTLTALVSGDMIPPLAGQRFP
ncbi:NAD(P)/FAD-dependent oxidoreductase [Frigidibacter sp. RF13]|uniref:FAD-dependent oxidoreductase n=1 Tax=Frigidibacter sp. RF13 TaxID=2997340 RepID=UPI00226FEEAB|nr:NAD(P)/FAD-dependent oxidoreductase [Frigidibacter sp. RF13]MCY1126959.1 NAD(P)/FAD-dependent oxidoreductase [Frigidibacter sp. RF13]